MIGLNCLKQGQIQKPHVHDDQDKFYYVVEGEGAFGWARNKSWWRPGRWSGPQPVSGMGSRMRATAGEFVQAEAKQLLLNPVLDEMEYLELLAEEIVP